MQEDDPELRHAEHAGFMTPPTADRKPLGQGVPREGRDDGIGPHVYDVDRIDLRRAIRHIGKLQLIDEMGLPVRAGTGCTSPCTSATSGVSCGSPAAADRAPAHSTARAVATDRHERTTSFGMNDPLGEPRGRRIPCNPHASNDTFP